MKFLFKKAYWFIYSKYCSLRQKYVYPFVDKIYSRKLEVSIADLMLQREEISQIQFLVASRLLDIEDYKSNVTVDKFRYQRAISIHDSGQKYMSDDTFDKKFESLIYSYSNKGYDKQSLLYVDNRFTLENGTHRMALHLHHNIPYVNVEYHHHLCSHQEGLYPFYQKKYNYLPTELINEVIERYKQIQQWLVDEGMTFSCLVCYNTGTEIDAFIKDISVLTNVLKVTRCSFDNHALYKKLDFVDNNVHIKKLANGLDSSYYIQFRLAKPIYIVNKDGYYSKTVEIIASILNERYPDKNSISFLITPNCGEGYKLFKCLFNTA